MEPERIGAELFKRACEQVRQTTICTKTRKLFGMPYAIEGKVTNNSKEATEGQIRFKLFDKEGCIIGEVRDYCDKIEAGETWHFKALITVDGYATFELASLYW